MGIGPRLASGVLHLLAPARCAGCDLPLSPAPEPFCPACSPLLEPTTGPRRPPAPTAAAFVYGGPLADAIARLKYGRRSDLARGLGGLLAGAALSYAGLVDRVIPLPLHPARLRERGFNQSGLLAAPVARALGVPLVTGALHRIRPTREQAGLGRSERSENVRGAFAVRGTTSGWRVLLIDDVCTTGATLGAATEALLASGAREVRALALAAAEA